LPTGLGDLAGLGSEAGLGHGDALLEARGD
jgi:hypothetical protein